MTEKSVKIPFAEALLIATPEFADSASNAEAFLNDLSNRRGEITITRIEQTERAYLHRAKNLLFTIERETGDVTPLAIYQWLLAKSKEIMPATLRQYRSALLFYMQTISETSPNENNAEMSAAMDAIRKIPSVKTIRVKRTSARKLRTIKERPLAHLITELRTTSPSKWDAIAADVFLGSLASGLAHFSRSWMDCERVVKGFYELFDKGFITHYERSFLQLSKTYGCWR